MEGNCGEAQKTSCKNIQKFQNERIILWDLPNRDQPFTLNRERKEMSIKNISNDRKHNKHRDIVTFWKICLQNGFFFSFSSLLRT